MWMLIRRISRECCLVMGWQTQSHGPPLAKTQRGLLPLVSILIEIDKITQNIRLTIPRLMRSAKKTNRRLSQLTRLTFRSILPRHYKPKPLSVTWGRSHQRLGGRNTAVTPEQLMVWLFQT